MAPTKRPSFMVLPAALLALSLVLGGASAALAQAGATAPRTQQLAFGTTQQSSSGYAYCVVVAKLVKEAHPNLNMTVISTGGSAENMTRTLRTHPFDLWIASAEVVQQSVRGGSEAVGKSDQWRLLWIVNNDGLIIAVREDSGIKTLQDLNGKRFYIGAAGSSAEATTKRILDGLGIKPNVVQGSLADASTDVQDGRAVGFAKAGSLTNPDASLLNLGASTKIRLLGLSEADVQTLKEKYPTWSFGSIRAGAYDNTAPVRVLMQPWGIWSDPKLDPATAERIVKVVLENTRPQKAAFPALTDDLTGQTVGVATDAGLTIHAGTYRYLTEKGIKLDPGLVPPEAR